MQKDNQQLEKENIELKAKLSMLQEAYDKLSEKISNKWTETCRTVYVESRSPSSGCGHCGGSDVFGGGHCG